MKSNSDTAYTEGRGGGGTTTGDDKTNQPTKKTPHKDRAKAR